MKPAYDIITHKLRESQLVKDSMGYEEAHAQSCKEYGITAEMEGKGGKDHPFYTEEALKAGEIEDISESF